MLNLETLQNVQEVFGTYIAPKVNDRRRKISDIQMEKRQRRLITIYKKELAPLIWHHKSHCHVTRVQEHLYETKRNSFCSPDKAAHYTRHIWKLFARDNLQPSYCAWFGRRHSTSVCWIPLERGDEGEKEPGHKSCRSETL